MFIAGKEITNVLGDRKEIGKLIIKEIRVVCDTAVL